MDDIISFDKSLHQRFTEFNEVLSGPDILSASQLQKQWALFLELTIDKSGWQAFWKVPRITCELLNIPFPSYALIIVLTVDTKQLRAYVRLLAVENDMEVPDKIWVPLTQLWPSKAQDKSIVLDLMETANSLDMLRFFYLYIYMPWDRDEYDTQDWKDKHLESRLKFYYDIKNGNIPRAVAQHIHNLLTEARRLQNKREFLEEQINKEEQDDLESDSVENDRTRILMEIHVRLLEIRTEIEIAENPLLRNIIIKRFSDLDKITQKSDPQIWLIFNEGTAEQHMNFLEQVKASYPTERLKFHTVLFSNLEFGKPNDVYLLNENIHKVLTTGALEEGGIIQGIGDRQKVILTSEVEAVMLDLMGDKIVLSNLTIDVSSSQCGILVRKGNCHIINCKIIGKPMYQGIVVLKGATLQLENCDISEFSTAITGNSESKLILKNCDIHHVNVGVKIFDESSANLQSVLFRECVEFGVVLETSKKHVIGSFECLQGFAEVEWKDVVGVNNCKGDVGILEPPKLKPFDDLFADPEKDLTLIESDDELNY